MLSMSSGNTLITAYVLDAPLGVDCERGVKLGNGTGTTVSPGAGVSSVGAGEPMNSVGVAVAAGGVGVASVRGCVQAPSARISNREVNIFLFIVLPLIAIILAFFERVCK
jgi:hypothetical protein